MASVYLKKNEEKRLTKGHQWIFSNEIGSKDDISDDVCVVNLYTSGGKYLGKGFYNGHSLISYRHLTDRDEEINTDFFRRRIIRAFELRKKSNRNREVFRLVNSESDFLPGLIIDKFGDKYSFQIFSSGMELFKSDIVEILSSEFNAALIVEKNKNELRNLEGLELIERVLKGNAGTFEISIDDIKYNIDLLKGQKSGFYIDQIDNRRLLREYIKKNHKVLDLFCNEGGFALNAAYMGAANITAVDISEHSICVAQKNARLNGFNNIRFIVQDVFDFLNSQFQSTAKYDLIILDPPSFTKSRKTLNSALNGYITLNSKCLRLLNYNALLFTYSCSHHVTESAFEEVLIKSAMKANRKIQMIHKHLVSYDHPVLLQMGETKYLKGYVLRVI
ncbi:MAG: class I SAM-dependent rRNA methyltransferase [Ignavibacteriaceae bacterium]|nr:class I SAM-dependent rRNA methyltransferase [Ignavibacteriaceae bacterium]